MFRRLALGIALVCALGVGPLCAASPATGLTPAVADCNQHATLTRSYSVTELRAALAAMPADIREYTDCYDVIQKALLAQVGQQHGSGSGQGGGPALPASVTRSAPGSGPPGWVVAVLIVLGLSAVSFAVLLVRRRRSA